MSAIFLEADGAGSAEQAAQGTARLGGDAEGVVWFGR